jgi:FAD/FMN-containing dehydrogenase
MASNGFDAEAIGKQLDGELLSAASPGWDEARGVFNVLLDQQPAAIALPESEADVAAIVDFAAANGLRVGAQRTGHSAEPLGSLAGTVLIRSDRMKGVEINREARSARVRAGALWGDLVPEASTAGLAALHGSAPSVGIVGYSLGGGVGWYGRKHGLACNRVSAVELVGADGKARRVDDAGDPELFWALRGGGGDFGIVTALEFGLLEVAEVFAGALFFPIERAAEVLHAWHEWTAGAPEEVTSVGRVMNFPPIPEIPEPMRGNSFAIVEAVFLGGEAEGAELLAPLRDLEPAMDSFAMVPPAGIAELHMDPPEPSPYAGEGRLVGDLPAAAIDAFLEVVGPGSGSQLVSVELRHDGGAMARSGADHGALDVLPGSFMLFGVGILMDPAAREPTLKRLGELTAAFEPYEAGRYLNFTDADVDVDVAFPPEAVSRLRAAKQKYDPENLFHANHPVVTG